MEESTKLRMSKFSQELKEASMLVLVRFGTIASFEEDTNLQLVNENQG